MLTDRQKLILKAIIEEYVPSNEPVGSKALTNKPYLSYSSALLRAEMQHLEDLGYLKKTHTSSGRVPSEMGYRYYVDHLIIRDSNIMEYYQYVDQIFQNQYYSKEDIIKKLTEFLSNLTGYYTAIVGSSSDAAKVFKMEIVALNETEAVLLIVTSNGAVQNQKITIPYGYKMDDLMRIISMFDNAMYGHSIYEIRDILSKEAAKPKIRQMVDFRDDILNYMIKSFERFMDNKEYVSGLSKLFNHPEFQEIDVVQRVLNAMDSEFIKSLVDGSQESGLQIRIGKEILFEGMDTCSIITIPYQINENEFGTILLIGPTRMNYRGAIPLLEYVAQSMKKLHNR